MITRTYGSPSVLFPLNPFYGEQMQTASKIKFYFRGGKDIIFLLKESQNNLSFFVPTFSTVIGENVMKGLPDLMEEITKEMETAGIGIGESFAIDLKTMKIITEDSFMDYIPYYSLKNALFIMYDAEGKYTQKLHYFSTNTDQAILLATMILYAKRELIATKSSVWTTRGKQMLAFLLANQYYIKGDFATEAGCWSSDTMQFPARSKAAVVERLSKLNLSRSTYLAGNIDATEDVEDDEDECPFGINQTEDLGGEIRLSDLLQIGIESFFTGTYNDEIEVTIDCCLDLFKTILLDTKNQICFVELNPGRDTEISNLETTLGTDKIQIMYKE